jgi:beta-porphyranase
LAVNVKDGFLKIQCSSLDPPKDKFTIACGTVQSKRKALYGYYECRMNAPRLTTPSNFWMVSDQVEVPKGKLGLELIVQFTIGKSKQFKDHMKSNAMVSLKPSGANTKRLKAKKTDRVKLKSSVADDFHTYGCWWINANTIKFYVDGEYAYTINPSTEFGEKPYRHPLTVNLICETFDWQPLPTHAELTAPARNTAWFDYVRSYQLVKDNSTK